MDYDAMSNPTFQKYVNDYRIQAAKKAIRQKESNGRYDAVGDNGTSYGAYQFQKGTWENMSRKYAGTVLEPTPKNQDYIMIMDIGNAIENEKLTPQQYFSRHNSGDPNKYLNGGVGYNAKIGVEYNVPKYVNETTSLFEQY
jgi:AraC-like DNA-binding protein